MGSQGTTSARLDRLQCSLRQRPEQYVGATPLASLRATGLPQTGQLRTLAQANYVVAELPELADSWPACPRWSLGNFSARCPPTGYRRRFAKRESRVANSGAPPIKKLLRAKEKTSPRRAPNRAPYPIAADADQGHASHPVWMSRSGYSPCLSADRRIPRVPGSGWRNRMRSGSALVRVILGPPAGQG